MRDSSRSAQRAVIQFSSRRREACFPNLTQDEKGVPESSVSQDLPYSVVFEAGRAKIKDLPSPGHAHVVINNATISAVDDLIQQNRLVTTREIAVELSISKETVHHIIHKKIGYGKVCAQWVPKHLSENQKTEREEVIRYNIYIEAIHSPPMRWDQCINLNGDYLQLYCST
ncbi:hypothetical protein AVEN_274047-1 [Araneus ventricosus]|uniref:Histone-lysine N-methyltransferase SETMAR n=1 Tax=Araneus ventricosus TaxID=182803 RepID=A0A4Y2JMG8_ARAVE|nr:hypothetical protein AVEN_274047-1 [Araneus ventricosus]